MTAKWRFEPKRRSQKSRDPMQDKFFSNASIDDDTQALVREAIQNSLDARRADSQEGSPVRIRFRTGLMKADPALYPTYFCETAWNHFHTDDSGLKEPPFPSEDCYFVAYEDFNTTGLIGDETKSDPEEKNAFYFFMRAEGQSGKQDGERGRHGVGKYVFPFTSRIRSFFAATVRSTDGRCLIAGQSVLKSHHVDGIQYTPDGWWGKFEDEENADYFPLPVENEDLLARMRTDFCLKRAAHETGLSIVMPFAQSAFNTKTITEYVVREYFWPILKKELVAEIADEDGNETILDADTIRSVIRNLFDGERFLGVSATVSLALKAIEKTQLEEFELLLPEKKAMPVWNTTYLEKESASAIRIALAAPGKTVRIRCPLHVQRDSKGTQASPSHFDIYVTKNAGDKPLKPIFIREGITITEDRVPTIRGYTSLIVIDRGPLATLLGDSENPAHTEWEKNAQNFRGKYKWGPTTINFVRLSMTKLLQLLNQNDSEEDISLLSDIFYLDLPEEDDSVPESRKTKPRNKPGPIIPPIFDPPPPRPRHYRIQKRESGFAVIGPKEELESKRMYRIAVAYDFSGASKASALKKYDENDFHLGKTRYVASVTHSGADNIEIGTNFLTFHASSKEFRIEVLGFDPNRDLVVDVQSREVENEEA